MATPSSIKILSIFPTLFAIFLLLIANSVSMYWERKIKSHFEGKEKFEKYIKLMTNVSLDWSLIYVYFTSMLVATQCR